jgi:hypothetical protein
VAADEGPHTPPGQPLDALPEPDLHEVLEGVTMLAGEVGAAAVDERLLRPGRPVLEHAHDRVAVGEGARAVGAAAGRLGHDLDDLVGQRRMHAAGLGRSSGTTCSALSVSAWGLRTAAS